MTKNPFTSQLLNASELMRGLSPAMVRQVLPLLDQLSPIYTDLAQGRLEFTPEPDETKRLIRTFYGELPCILSCSYGGQMLNPGIVVGRYMLFRRHAALCRQGAS